LCALLLLWSAASSLWIYPHSLSYFNESIGGPLNGPKHLLGSNVDWVQDLRYLIDWFDQQKENSAGELALVMDAGFLDVRSLGLISDQQIGSHSRLNLVVDVNILSGRRAYNPQTSRVTSEPETANILRRVRAVLPEEAIT